MSRQLMREFVHLLVMGDPLGLQNVLAEDATVADPTLGVVGGERLSELAGQWRNRGGALDPTWVGLTTTPERSVAEFEIGVSGPEGHVPLPVCAVGEPGDDERLQTVRLYHSFWPLEGGHRLREPLIECDPAEKPSDVVGRYLDALNAGDLDAVISCFAEDSYAREPAGGQWTYRGLARIRQFYSSILAEGGITLSHCTVTDDGTRCALEFVATHWGKTDLPHQAGCAVYERIDRERLLAARIYDDVTPPE